MTKVNAVAVIDGAGEYADVALYLADEDGDVIEEIKWPDSWPSWVSRKFLEDHGFEVRTA
jgi:hypothetical protein